MNLSLQGQKRQIHDVRKALARMPIADIVKCFEDVLPKEVLQSFEDLRRSFRVETPVVGSAPNLPFLCKGELTLKEALALFPAPETTTWML